MNAEQTTKRVMLAIYVTAGLVALAVVVFAAILLDDVIWPSTAVGAPTLAGESQRAVQLADLRAREASAPPLTGSTCTEVVAQVVIPQGWTIRCVDAIPDEPAWVQGMTYGETSQILVKNQTDPSRMRYFVVHEAGHAWGAVILDNAARAYLADSVGGSWASGEYRAQVTEAWADAWAYCHGAGSSSTYTTHVTCTQVDGALDQAAHRDLTQLETAGRSAVSR